MKGKQITAYWSYYNVIILPIWSFIHNKNFQFFQKKIHYTYIIIYSESTFCRWLGGIHINSIQYQANEHISVNLPKIK